MCIYIYVWIYIYIHIYIYSILLIVVSSLKCSLVEQFREVTTIKSIP